MAWRVSIHRTRALNLPHRTGSDVQPGSTSCAIMKCEAASDYAFVSTVGEIERPVSPSLSLSADLKISEPTTLFSLPNELLQYIALLFPEHEAFSSIFALRWTCRDLRGILPAPPSPPEEVLSERSATRRTPSNSHVVDPYFVQLQCLEAWPEYNCLSCIAFEDEHSKYRSLIPPEDRLGCQWCYKFLPISAFPKSQALKSSIKGRFCIDCGIKKLSLKKGQTIHFFRKRRKGPPQSTGMMGTAFVCGRCGKPEEASSDSREFLRKKCTWCLFYRPP